MRPLTPSSDAERSFSIFSGRSLSRLSRQNYSAAQRRRLLRRDNRNSNVILQQVAIIIIFWFIAFFISDEDDQHSLWTKESHMQNLRLRVLTLMLVIGASFLSMAAVARFVRNSDGTYKMFMYLFLMFVVSCEFAIFLTIMKMVKVQYGNDFRRKVYVQVGEPQVTDDGIVARQVTLHFNDGTYQYDQKGRITGQKMLVDKGILHKGDTDTTVKGYIEPKVTYFRRIFIGLICLSGLTTLLVTLMVISLFFMAKTVQKIHIRYRMSVRTALRNGIMMNLMNHFPYSKFMLSEARDCPICFEQFKDNDEVVQLKCNDLHIFHYKCMEKYLFYEDENVPLTGVKQCPLCRVDVEVQENPNFKS